MSKVWHKARSYSAQVHEHIGAQERMGAAGVATGQAWDIFHTPLTTQWWRTQTEDVVLRRAERRQDLAGAKRRSNVTEKAIKERRS